MLLEEFLFPAKISQRAFASKIGWTVAKLNELINGKRGVTADSALDLAGALHTSPELWLNLQMYFDLHRAEQRRKKASRSSPAHERHDLDFIPIFQRHVILVESDEPAIQFDGDLLGDEFERRDDGAQGRVIRKLARVAVDFDLHGKMIAH
jgi:addiction module HigA family antidote